MSKEKKVKTEVLEKTSGTVDGIHFDQVQSSSGLTTYYMTYVGGKRLKDKKVILAEEIETQKTIQRIFFAPFRLRGIYPFNLGDRNIEPSKYGKVIDLWNEVWQYYYDHWDYGNKAYYDVLTAWTFATYLPEKWDFLPYLAAIGDTGTGKTRMLECLAALCYNGWLSTCFNEAPLFRCVTMWNPTILIDESEILTNDQRASVQSLLNAGQKRGVSVPRAQQVGRGTMYKIKLFQLFGFKALAGTKMWLRTLRRRSLIAFTTKTTRKVERRVDKERATKLRSKLLQYRIDYIDVPFEDSRKRIDELTKLVSGGIYELFFALFSVAPTSKWKSILEYARKEEHSREGERGASEVAEVFYAILQVKDEKNNIIKLKKIAQYLNMDREPREFVTSKYVSAVVTTLGFLKKHMRYGTVMVWNQTTVDRLKKQYGFEDVSIKRDDVTEKSPYHTKSIFEKDE